MFASKNKKDTMNTGHQIISVKNPMTRISVLLLCVLSKILRERNLIDQQICVYLSWQERHKGWSLHGEEEWLEQFIKYSKISDVADVKSEMVDDFLEKIRTESNSDYEYRHAKTAIYRFLRFYQARTKGFTSNPRSVVFK